MYSHGNPDAVIAEHMRGRHGNKSARAESQQHETVASGYEKCIGILVPDSLYQIYPHLPDMIGTESRRHGKPFRFLKYRKLHSTDKTEHDLRNPIRNRRRHKSDKE